MAKRGLLLAVLVAAAGLAAARGGAPGSRAARRLWAGVRGGLERGAIRWSGSLLRSMGAVQSAPRAEQEAMLAHKVATALSERLPSGAKDVTVLIIGGVIHLEGRVRSPRERAEAEMVARQVSGAQVVADDLRASGPRG